MTTSATAASATSEGPEGDMGARHEEPAISGETSSRNHRLSHQYAANHDQFPGWLEQGGTDQSVGRPVVLAEVNVGKPAVSRADSKPARTRRKSRPSN
jgi:hypothetical protein